MIPSFIWPLVAWVALAVMASVATVMAILLWRHNLRIERIILEANKAAFAADVVKRRAMVRGVPTICISVWGIVLGLSVVLHDEMTPESSGAGSFWQWAGIIGGLFMLFSGLVLNWLIVRLNRPSFLVPPHLRWEPGYQAIREAQARGEGITTFNKDALENWEAL